jgi:type II secretory pathway pseudopilin PulG
MGEVHMRTRLLAAMVAALVLALAAPAMAGPREDARDRRKAMQLGGARVALIANGETKENLEQVVVNHLGNPDQGQVLIQTWVEPDWTDFEAVDIQGAVQAVKILRSGAGFAKRVAIRVELYGDLELHASSSTVNTGDVNGTAYVQTPEAGNLTTEGRPCLWYSVGYYTIRWDDDTLTSGRFLVARGDWVNPICQVTPASDLRAR